MAMSVAHHAVLLAECRYARGDSIQLAVGRALRSSSN
jgi:hypothetical protein